MHKILVADDSTTIQKVIKMTLDDLDVDLFPVLSENEMMEKMNDNVDLLLLDYGLSATKSGIEIATKLHSQFENLKIVALMSTFDQVERPELLENGFNESVTKPFDSRSFIEVVSKMLVGDDDTSEIEVTTILEEDEVVDSTELDQWQVGNDQEPVEKSSDTNSIPIQDVSLESVIDDWGVEIPAPVHGVVNFSVVPPVVDETVDETVEEVILTDLVEEIADDKYAYEEVEMVDDKKFPKDNDLVYPEISDIEDLKTSSTLISVDTLNKIDASTLNDDTDPNIKISNYEGCLDDLVSDEEGDSDDLWSVDDGLKMEQQAVEVKEDNVDKELSPSSELEELPNDEIIDAAVDETIQTAFNSFNRDSFLEEIKNEIKNDLLHNSEFIQGIKEELSSVILNDNSFREEIKRDFIANMKEEIIYLAKSDLKKISWEVIPDLAENLIRSEIKNISENL